VTIAKAYWLGVASGFMSGAFVMAGLLILAKVLP